MARRLDRIASLEAQIAALQAKQLALTATFVADRINFDSKNGFAAGEAQYRSMVAEVAIAKRVSVITAATFMDDAYQLTAHHPAILQALKSGRLGLAAARSVVHETCVLDNATTMALADQVIAEEAVDVLPGKVRALAERRVAEIDPDAAARRSARERADKHVVLSPAGSGMAWLNAYLPAEHGVAAFNSVREHAHRLRAAGDPRTVSHLMCDTVVERLTGTSTESLPAHVSVVMTDTTLLGASDQPAHLLGGGPLPADVARRLATGENAWLRRFLTDPVDGSLTHGDTRRRRFDGALRDLVISRDQHCRGIQCSCRIRDIDHIETYASGGKTSLKNAQGLSRNCHTTRNDPRMRVQRDEQTGVITWVTPSGLSWHSLAPPSLAPGSLTPTQRHLRHHLTHPPPSTMERLVIQGIVTDIRHRPRRL